MTTRAEKIALEDLLLKFCTAGQDGELIHGKTVFLCGVSMMEVHRARGEVPATVETRLGLQPGEENTPRFTAWGLPWGFGLGLRGEPVVRCRVVIARDVICHPVASAGKLPRG
jgi:hypothetical protein